MGVQNGYSRKQIDAMKGTLNQNRGVIYPLKNIKRSGVDYPVDDRVKNVILDIKVIGAKNGKVYTLDYIGNGAVVDNIARYGVTISEYDKATFETNAEASKRQLIYYRTIDFPAPTTDVVTRIVDIEGEDISFVITYDKTKMNGISFPIADIDNGYAKGTIIDENCYSKNVGVNKTAGNLLANQGSVFPFKSLKRDGSDNKEIQEMHNAILNVKVINAKPGKKYKIDFLGNGTTAWGDPNYSVYLQEMDDNFMNIVQIFTRTNQTNEIPPKGIVSKFITNTGTDIILAVTIDYSKLNSLQSYVMNTSTGNGYGYIIDESCYIYKKENPEVKTNLPLVCRRDGKRLRVKSRYSDSKDLVIDFDELGINAIIHPKRFYMQDRSAAGLSNLFSDAGLWHTITTDWISPYGIMATTNTVSSSSFTVGGNHGTDSGSGFATARFISCKLKADNVEIKDGEVAFAQEKITIETIHYISASNAINTTTGSKRDSVKEIVTYTVTPNNIAVSVTLEALEPVKITRYFGLQTTKSVMQDKMYYMPDTTPTIFDITTLDFGESGKRPSSSADRFVLSKDENVLVGYINRDIGIGFSQIADNEAVIYHTDTKVYMPSVKGTEVTMAVGDSMYYYGGYTLMNALECTGAQKAYFTRDGDKKVYCVDFFNAVSNTFLKIPEEDRNKRVEVIQKGSGVTVDSFVSGKGLKMSATGYSQLKFILK